MKGYTIVQYLALLWRFHQATDFIVASRFFVCEVCVAAFFESVASLDSFHIFIRVFCRGIISAMLLLFFLFAEILR